MTVEPVRAELTTQPNCVRVAAAVLVELAAQERVRHRVVAALERHPPLRVHRLLAQAGAVVDREQALPLELAGQAVAATEAKGRLRQRQARQIPEAAAVAAATQRQMVKQAALA
jgi:hypothetical protein